MAEVKQVDIKIYCGEDFEMSFICRDTNGDVIDLTGATIRGVLRQYPSGTDPYDFVMTNYGASGKVRMQMPHETTALISYAYGRYEVDVTKNGVPDTKLWGLAFIIPEVTRITTGTPEMILAFNEFKEFPEVGTYFRLYLDIKHGMLYRWNGTMYENALAEMKGEKGDPGRGIVAIRKISTTGNTDRYEIVYDDDTSDYFYVTNGSSIATIQKTGTSGVQDTYTITLTNGDTSTFTVTNGSSIVSITKTDTEDLVDTYTILLTNGETSTFQVRNGEDGIGSLVRVDGQTAYVSTLNAFENEIIAPMFDSGTAYTTGDYVIYENALYRFISDHAAGDWDASQVTPVTVASDKVSKAGDTLTGSLTIDSAPFIRRVSEYDSTVNPEDNKSKDVFYVTDVNDIKCGMVRFYYGTTGDHWFGIYARREVGGSTLQNGINFQIASDGTCTVNIDRRNEFLDALQLGDSGWLSITGTSGDSGNFVGTIYYRKIGKLVEVSASDWFTLKSNVSAAGNVLLASLPSGYRPGKTVMGECFVNSSSTLRPVPCRISTGGDIYLYAGDNSHTIPSGTNMTMSAMFFV